MERSYAGERYVFHFWGDVWLGDTSLAHQYPSLYNIVNRKNVLVSDVLLQTPLNIGFRRSLTWQQMDMLVAFVSAPNDGTPK